MKTRARGLVIAVLALAAGVALSVWTRRDAVRQYDVSAVPADFVTLRHMSEDLVVRAPPGWAYFPQPFRRQNDILVALYPPGAVWTDDSPTRLYLHGHALPDGVTFDDFVRGHERYTEGQA